MPIDPAKFHEAFFDEVRDHLQSVENLVIRLQDDNASDEDLDALFRVAHSIKGGSATFGLQWMADFTHVMESVLDRVRSRAMLLSDGVVDLILQSRDVLEEYIAARRRGDVPDQSLGQSVREGLRALLAEPSARQSEQSAYGFFDEPQQPAVAASVRVERNDPAASTIRVKVGKVDTLINLAGQLLIAQDALVDAARAFGIKETDRLYSALSGLERPIRELRESVMSIRMLPIGSIFDRFPRLVRDLGRQLGKEVDFVSSGDETELDKTLLEGISDPLTHLVRNAVGHGIEPPELREAAGKPRSGRILVRSYQRGGTVYVEVTDDGAGLRRQRIIEKARALGIDCSDDLPDDQVWKLVFTPGLSTTEAVSDLSGRGVGMDVVKQNVEALGGDVEVQSTVGAGTTVRLRVPLTLAILDGLSVRADQHTFIVPLNFIVETIILEKNSIFNERGGAMLMFRDEPIPVVSLRKFVGAQTESAQIALVVESEGRKMALLVDSVESEHQVVIKSLESNFRRMPGYSGATVLGNGKVALILDVTHLLRTLGA